MITGFNTDVKHGAKVYHVQTEDKGRNNPKIETLVYVGGEILDNYRTSYEKSKAELSEEEIMDLLEGQHKRIIRSIKLGKYDEPIGFPDGLISPRSLDEVISDYLATEELDDPLKLIVNGVSGLKINQMGNLKIETRKQGSGEPLSGSDIRVKLVHPTQRTLNLADGRTDPTGLLTVKITLPDWGAGNCSLIVSAISEWGAFEQEFPLQR